MRLTFGTLVVMLLAYRSGLIKVTDKLRLGIVAATGGIMVFYLIQFVLGSSDSRFAAVKVPGRWHRLQPVRGRCGGAEPGAGLRPDRERRGLDAPKYMEWYSGFALMVTLIWLYLEMLRLLSKMRER